MWKEGENQQTADSKRNQSETKHTHKKCCLQAWFVRTFHCREMAWNKCFICLTAIDCRRLDFLVYGCMCQSEENRIRANELWKKMCQLVAWKSSTGLSMASVCCRTSQIWITLGVLRMLWMHRIGACKPFLRRFQCYTNENNRKIRISFYSLCNRI